MSVLKLTCLDFNSLAEFEKCYKTYKRKLLLTTEIYGISSMNKHIFLNDFLFPSTVKQIYRKETLLNLLELSVRIIRILMYGAAGLIECPAPVSSVEEVEVVIKGVVNDS